MTDLRSATFRAGTGFTLIELLIVIVILGILAGISMVAAGSIKARTQVAVMKSDLRSIAVAQEVYYDSLFESGVRSRRVRYARRVNQLDFTPSAGVTVRMRGNRNGWTAQARHSATGRRRCAIFRGRIRRLRPAEKEGVVTCT